MSFFKFIQAVAKVLTVVVQVLGVVLTAFQTAYREQPSR